MDPDVLRERLARGDILDQNGVPQQPGDLQRHRYLRLTDPLYRGQWDFGDEQLDALPTESFQVNVAEALVKAHELFRQACS